MLGPKKQDFWPKINILKKPLYFENTGSTSLSKIGHDLKKRNGSKIDGKLFFEKNGLLNWYVFLNGIYIFFF